ncbi:MAG: tRNA 2-thiouridine(34) synthase MnmA [Actinomycetes bacterium]
MKVLAALSGGVDSAVAAARAVDAGHDVVGVHLALSAHPAALRTGSRGCCSREDARDAARVADILGIPFYVWDFSDEFASTVIDDFVAEYDAGRTPNPCVRCNEQIKFAAVLDRGLSLGFDAVCTGHYARLQQVGAHVELHRAVDLDKDQSYVLGVLDQRQLSRSLFPLGASSKPEVRTEAQRRGLLVADKPDSHDICFIADGDTAGFLRERLGVRPGSIVDESGRTVGAHEGAYAFTVGQRRGLALGTPAADGRPRYVLSIEPVAGTVTVGPKDRLGAQVFDVVQPRWCTSAPELPAALSVQTRAHGRTFEVTLAVGSGTRSHSTVCATAVSERVPAVPGQTAVFYQGTEVVGAATIAATWSAR